MPGYVCELVPAPFLLFWFAVEPPEVPVALLPLPLMVPVPVTLAVLVAELPEAVVTPKFARLMPL